MTKRQIIVGVDERGNGVVGYVHPFLAGARKQETRVPTEIVARKTGKVRQGYRCVPDGALKPVAKRGER
jgi:hypothetical protein